MEENLNILPDINKGRLTAMRWCYTAVMLILCCISDTLLIFLSVSHALIFIILFLRSDTSFHVNQIREIASFEAKESLNIKYLAELEAKKPCWFDQFIVYKTHVDEESFDRPIVSAHVERSWKAAMEESIENGANTIEFDVSPSLSRSYAKKREVDFEMD